MSVQSLFETLGLGDEDASYEMEMMWIPLDSIEDITWLWNKAQKAGTCDAFATKTIAGIIKDFKSCYASIFKQEILTSKQEEKLIVEACLDSLLEGDDEGNKIETEMYNYFKMFIINNY